MLKESDLRQQRQSRIRNSNPLSIQHSAFSISLSPCRLYWRARHPMFINSLIARVSGRTRAKGADYFRSGAVIEIGGGEWSAHAIVRGTRDYRVELRRESGTGGFSAPCECPYYTDRGEVCKHIWAALLEAERRELLAGDGPILPDATLEAEYGPPSDEPVTSAPQGATVRGTVRPVWERFLHELQRDVVTAERAKPAPRFANGELIYSIDVDDTLNGLGTVINVLFRQRRKNGEWRKPRPANVTANEAEHLANPADREILSLLLGAGNSSSYGTTYDPGFSRSRYVLNGPLEDVVLPLMAQSGRGVLDRHGNEQGFFGFVWDDGPPWRFDLQIAAENGTDPIRVDGSFVRAGQRLDLREPVLLLSRGFLFTHTALARLEVGAAF